MEVGICIIVGSGRHIQPYGKFVKRLSKSFESIHIARQGLSHLNSTAYDVDAQFVMRSPVGACNCHLVQFWKVIPISHRSLPVLKLTEH